MKLIKKLKREDKQKVGSLKNVLKETCIAKLILKRQRILRMKNVA